LFHYNNDIIPYAAARNFFRVSSILITKSDRSISYAICLISQGKLLFLDELVRYYILAGIPGGLVPAAGQDSATIWSQYLTIRFL